MSPEKLIIALVVSLAVGFLGRLAWRTFAPRRPGGCAGGCGCGPKVGRR